LFGVELSRRGQLNSIDRTAQLTQLTDAGCGYTRGFGTARAG
jgi:hypothetical protein